MQLSSAYRLGQRSGRTYSNPQKSTNDLGSLYESLGLLPEQVIVLPFQPVARDAKAETAIV